MKKLLILISLLWSAYSVGQNSVSSPVWLAKSGNENFISALEEGYNAFYLDSLPEFNKEAYHWEQLLNSKQNILLITNEAAKKASGFPGSLEKSTNLLNLSEDIKIYQSGANQFNFIRLKKNILTETELCREYNLVAIDSLNNREEIDDFLFKILHRKGVVPHVISSPHIADIDYLKRQFSKKPVYKARVTFNGEELNNVAWKEFPHLETCGVFRTSDSTLAPLKRGYMFSPDIYNFTDKNTKISGPKTFKAIKYELEEKLKYSLPLNRKLINEVNPKDMSTPTDITFTHSAERDKEVAVFNGSSGFIDIRSETNNPLEEISISAWIKPDEIKGSFSLVGKGEAFSAKVYHGRLQFTATGIKDHNTSEKIIEKDKWSHIAFVYVPKRKIYFYLNGKLIEEIEASDINQTDHALLIGTNLWGQYYSGLLSDLKIWDRALSDDEIQRIFSQKIEMPSNSTIAWSWPLLTGSVLILMVGGLILFKRKSKKPEIKSSETPQRQEKEIIPREFCHNSITLLNGFNVWNEKGEDITSRFSPKRRELLILILLFTIKDGGITSKKLSDILWPGFTPKNKKNNRSTQIKEIRKILKDQISAEVIFSDKKWQFQMTGTGKVDVLELNTILPNFWVSKKIKPTNTEALDFARIISRGALLPQIEEEWLDNLKAEYNSRVLDLLSPFLEEDSFTNAEKLEIIEAILVVDPLFELAVKKKISCLLQEGKFGSAKKVVESFKKLYESYYNEEVDPEFLKIVK